MFGSGDKLDNLLDSYPGDPGLNPARHLLGEIVEYERKQDR